MDYATYGVMAKKREPLLEFMVNALEGAGCTILRCSPANKAPFRISFETSEGERLGIIAYAFLANQRLTKNRPADEHRFQIKYGSKQQDNLHELYQDPYSLYTTLLLGINPEEGFFVGADPEIHNPTKFFISIEFKQEQVDAILRNGWHVWERDRRGSSLDPVEVLVGGRPDSFLQYIRFERAALREDQGHRQLIAERASQIPILGGSPKPIAGTGSVVIPGSGEVHALCEEFEMSEERVLDLIASARRLKMAVRGWVAEEKLVDRLQGVEGVTDCVRLEEEKGPDVSLRYRGSRLITVECKNILRNTLADGTMRLDLQRTRASKSDPCSRFYEPSEWDVVAACLHSVTERWEFRYALPTTLDEHKRCPGHLSNNVRIDARWLDQAAVVLERVAEQ